MILQITDDDGRTKTDEKEHTVRAMARQVDRVLTENWHETDLVGWLEESVDGRMLGVTPDLSGMVDDIIQEAILPFSLEEVLEQTNTGFNDGSGNTTAIHVLYGHTIAETVEHLIETEQLKAAKLLFEQARDPGDPTAETLVAYCVFTYSKGWTAEQIVTDDDRFAKLWITNDQAGQDVRDLRDNDEKQIKSIPFYARSNTDELRRKDIPHYFYAWTEDGLLLADVDDANEANGRAATQGGITKTAYKKTTKTGTMNGFGRRGRVLWW